MRPRHFLNAFYDTAFPKIPVKKYSISEVEQLQKKNPKKVLVNLSSSFCNTGRVMSLTTFIDTSVAAYINKNFYVVDFDVTTSDTIIFKGEKHYKVLVNNFPMHSLSLKLSNNRFTMPTLCILDEKLNTIEALNFYQSPERLKPVLKFYGSNIYKTKSFADFTTEETNKNTSPAKK